MTRPEGRVDLRRTVRLAAMALAFLGGMWISIAFPHAAALPGNGDAVNYWNAKLPTPYTGVEGDSTITYSPAAVLALQPLIALPWPVFHVLWATINVWALVWMARGWALPLLLFPPVMLELYLGQVHLLMAAAIVASFRHAGWWAVPLLTKATPGIGLLWYAVRREWRPFAIGAGTTLAVAATSAVVVPDLWRQWFVLLQHSKPVDVLVLWTAPLSVRLAVAAVIVGVAAVRGWRWAIPIAAIFALPTMWTFGASMVAGSIALLRPAEAPPVPGSSTSTQRSTARRSGWRSRGMPWLSPDRT